MKRTYLILATIVLVAYAAPLLGGATFIGRDHLTHTIPSKQVVSDAISAGHLPEWWDGVDMGVPFAANPNHSALYPPCWIVAALPMPWSADVLLVLHVLLAGLGCAALARRLGADAAGSVVAGAAFMLAGFVPSTLVHGGPLLTLAWMPWIAWAAFDVGRGLALAALIGAQLLAGDPSFAIAGGLLAISIVAVHSTRKRRDLAVTVGAAVAGALVAAVVVLPALLLARESSRAGGIAHDAAVAWSMHPLRILEWIWPDALGDPNQPSQQISRSIADASGPLRLSPSWALSVYVSLPVLVAAVIAWSRDRRLRILAMVALGFFLLALGRYTPIYGLYRLVFVPERFVRYPEKYALAATLLVCVAAGCGWTSLTRDVPSRATYARISIAAGVLAAAALAARIFHTQLAATIGSASLHPALDADAGVLHAATEGLTAALVAFAVIASLYLSRRDRRLSYVAAGILVAHLVGRTWALLPTFDREILAAPPAVVRSIAGAPHRIARSSELRARPAAPLAARARTLYEGALANVATRFGIAYLVGYDQGQSARFDRWSARVAAAGPRGLDLYAADYEVILADDADARDVLATDAPFGPDALIARPHARPRAFVASSWQWFAGEESVDSVLLPAGDVPLDQATAATAHLIGHGEPSPPGSPQLTPCELRSPRPELVHMTCDASRGGYAVLLDTYAPGWSATLDGAPATIERAEGVARAVRVSAGHHEIEFRYATPGLRLGGVISTVAIALLVAFAIGRGYFDKRSTSRCR